MLMFAHLPEECILYIASDNPADPVLINSMFCVQHELEKCGGNCCLGEKDCHNNCPNRGKISSIG